MGRQRWTARGYWVVTHTGAGRGWSSGTRIEVLCRDSRLRSLGSIPSPDECFRAPAPCTTAQLQPRRRYCQQKACRKGSWESSPAFLGGGEGGRRPKLPGHLGPVCHRKKNETKRKSRQSVSELSFKNKWVCAVHSHCRTALMGYDFAAWLFGQTAVVGRGSTKKKGRKRRERTPGRLDLSRPGCHV